MVSSHSIVPPQTATVFEPLGRGASSRWTWIAVSTAPNHHRWIGAYQFGSGFEVLGHLPQVLDRFVEIAVVVHHHGIHIDEQGIQAVSELTTAFLNAANEHL